MQLERHAIPTRYGCAIRAAHQLLAIRRQQRVRVLDVMEVPQDRLGRRRRAHGPEMPLQVTDPQHQLRHRHRPRVLLQAQELVRIDAGTGQRQAVALARHHVGQRIQHLAFQALHHLHRHIQEVAGAAGRVQHPHGAQPGMELPQRRRRTLPVTRLQLPVGVLFYCRPLRAARQTPLGSRCDVRAAARPVRSRPRCPVRRRCTWCRWRGVGCALRGRGRR